MKRSRILGLMTSSAILASSGLGVLATEKIARQEKVECVVCHQKPGVKEFTDRGKYYETLRTLEGYDKLKDRFGNCLYCHKGEPGSKKLTRKGKRVREVVRDMRGLFEWLKEGHTGVPGE